MFVRSNKVNLYVGIITFYIFGVLNSQGEDGMLFTNLASEQSITTFDDFLNHIRWEESQSVGLDKPEPKQQSSTDFKFDTKKYDSLISSCVAKINHDRIKYIDGKTKSFARNKNGLLALEALVAAALAVPTVILPHNKGLGFLAAKIVFGALAAGMSAVAIAQLMRQINGVALTTFDQEGLTYNNIKGGVIGEETHFSWKEVNSVKVSRRVALYKKQKDVAEVIYVELKDKADKTLCKYSDMYFPVGVTRFLELVSFYRGKALSVSPDSLPISVWTSTHYMDKYKDSERKQVEQWLISGSL